MLVQIDKEIERFDISSCDIESIFIGGGTPSAVEYSYYKEIFAKILPYCKDDIEITTEANPNSATYEWLSGMKDIGVNRVSFGVQSFDDSKLKLLGRNHTSNIAKKALEEASKLYKNISLDLIYNVKGDTISLLQSDLDIAISSGINHLSAYSLTLESNTKFEDSDMAVDDDGISYQFISMIDKQLPQYEISNFGHYHSLHNMGYWQYRDYVGVGAGAVGFIKDKRLYPSADVKSYIDNPNNISIEELSYSDIVFEKIFLGLRSCVGVDMSILDKKRVDILDSEDKVYIKDNRVYNKNYLLADEIALFLSDD
jgi:oxygen-independent coproporphyrinogen-3 oxidase